MSTSAPWTLRAECKCGHHKDTHFEGKHNCLGLHCDCARYRKFDEPEPPPETKRSAPEPPPEDEPAPPWSWTFPLLPYP